MSARSLDGTSLAKAIREGLGQEVDKLKGEKIELDLAKESLKDLVDAAEARL